METWSSFDAVPQLIPLCDYSTIGIGVDDMFVIVEAWKNLTPEEQKLSLPEQVAMTMKHAGVSVTVTSVTDIVAFAIGASTVSK